MVGSGCPDLKLAPETWRLWSWFSCMSLSISGLPLLTTCEEQLYMFTMGRCVRHAYDAHPTGAARSAVRAHRCSPGEACANDI